jgi:hypothetical protein
MDIVYVTEQHMRPEPDLAQAWALEAARLSGVTMTLGQARNVAATMERLQGQLFAADAAIRQDGHAAA